MLRGHGVASGTSDGVVNRRPHRMFGRSSERKSPLNVQFERQVARLESRQQQQRCIIFTVIPLNFCCDSNPSLRTENGNNHPSSELTSPEDILCLSSSSPSSPPMILLHLNAPDEPHKICPDNPSRLLAEKSTASNSMPNSDFLVDSFTKTSVNASRTARRKSKKKSKKHRQRCKKPTDGSEIKCRESSSAAPSVDVVDCEGLTLSPKHVGDIVFEDTFSPSSSVKEASEEAPDSENDNEYHGCSVTSVSSASYCDETELSRPTTSCLELFGQCNSSNFRYLDNTPNSIFMDSSQETCYASGSLNGSDDTKTLLIFRNECGPDPCETTEICSSNDGFDENWLERSNHASGLCSQNCVGTCNRVQAVHLCSDASSDSDFHLVISRKRVRKEKKMSLWKSFNVEHASTVTHGRNEKYASRSSRQMIKELSTKDLSNRKNHVGSIHPQHGVALKHSTKNFIHKPSNVCVEPQDGIPSKDSKAGTSRNHFTSPKENSSGKSNVDFNKEQNIDLNKKVSNTGHSRESNCCEMRSNSAFEPTTPKSAKGNCTSESVKSTDSTLEALHMQKRGLQASLQVNYATDTSSELPSSYSKSTQTNLVVRPSAVPSVEGNHIFRKFCSSKMHLIEMIEVVNDAYEVQVAADVHLAAGHPITDLETFIYSATPVIGHVPCMKISNCSRDQLVSNSVCQQHISNVSLRSIWEWYEEPGCYGLEVRALNDLSSKASLCNSSEFYTYFVPYLSAIQLFGWSMKNMDHSFGVEDGDLLETTNTASLLGSHPVHAKLHQPFEQNNTCFSESSLSEQDHGELIFEYFETEQPSFRPPLFEKIKELVSGINVSDHRIFGDPEKLQNVKLCDLHPASWFCVAWYPVYRVPRGNFRAAFLTYHSLGKLVPQKCSPDLTGWHTRIVSPVVGLQSYNDKGEQWFQLRCPDFKQLPIDDSSKPSRAEVLKERLRTLKRGALAMARAVIPKGTGETVNHHPDYEFFLSRST